MQGKNYSFPPSITIDSYTHEKIFWNRSGFFCHSAGSGIIIDYKTTLFVMR